MSIRANPSARPPEYGAERSAYPWKEITGTGIDGLSWVTIATPAVPAT
jgi:hypothetical protein